MIASVLNSGYYPVGTINQRYAQSFNSMITLLIQGTKKSAFTRTIAEPIGVNPISKL
ncbi:hypothetical protein [Sphingobacterium sp. BIGb0165]|uniref:hypothetical protein n=1 Tax=Sphingobacterium sp. BIGb0165 TaxID=2940615 RepID=UPI0021689FD7|nr:hypothetical protein [Sphingobacterium sp. BIGb0165]MCS4227549.1 hypothetical protein [Sphingobacterium sp. BIGb0165]